MLLRRLLALATLIALAAPAQAQLSRSFSSATYTGVGASQVKADFDNLGKAYNLDAIGGYHIVPKQPWGQIAAELNLGVTVSPGKNQGSNGTPGGVLGGGTDATGNNTETSDDLQTFIFSLQGVYRSPGKLYGIGSVGFGLINTSIPEIEDSGRTSFNYGGGLGFKFGEETAAVELLYSRVSSDLQTLGIRFIY